MSPRPHASDLPSGDDPLGKSTDRLDTFYRDLEKLLLEQLKHDPSQHHLRLKLLEMYFETRRLPDFMKHAIALSRVQRDQASREWQKCVSMGIMLAPGEPLFATAQRDTVEFVGESEAAAATTKPTQIRRFGDEPRRAKLFEQLSADYEKARSDPAFLAELDRELMPAARRPSSMIHARRLSEQIKGGQIFLKREDLSPGDTHLTVTVVGTALLARRLGKRTLVTGTTDGRRGVIMSSIAARLGLKAVVFMDAEDMHRQSANVFRLWLMGADLQSVDAKTLRNQDVREAALDYWGQNNDSLLVIGLDAAPPPYPLMAREFTAAIGREVKRQVVATTRRMPDVLVARGGNNADALGFFPPFLTAVETRLVCVTPVRERTAEPKRVGADPFDPSRIPLTADESKVARVILEGLEYPGVTREHAWLKASGRVDYLQITETAAKNAIQKLSHLEGIIPAIETAHALAAASDIARTLKPEQSVVLMMAEDAAKDLWDIGRKMGVPF